APQVSIPLARDVALFDRQAWPACCGSRSGRRRRPRSNGVLGMERPTVHEGAVARRLLPARLTAGLVDAYQNANHFCASDAKLTKNAPEPSAAAASTPNAMTHAASS